jgi:hypothetical protein
VDNNFMPAPINKWNSSWAFIPWSSMGLLGGAPLKSYS